MSRKKEKHRQVILCVAIVVWVIGLVLLPSEILTDYYDYKHGDSYSYDALNPIIGAMYVSPAFFLAPMMLFSILFDDKSGIAPKMTLAFYIAVTIVFVTFSVKKTEFVYSAIAMVLSMAIITFLVVTDKVK